MRYCANPTADKALSHISREWERLSDLAERIQKDPYSDWSREQSKKFTGIFKRLLTDPHPEKRAS